jgi:hypothetical protein
MKEYNWLLERTPTTTMQLVVGENSNNNKYNWLLERTPTTTIRIKGSPLQGI